ncbi:MAG: DNA-processing protein DprA [Clostridia bacterium]|nr:DNA-processing protein DprA [Clostridia bacterium]
MSYSDEAFAMMLLTMPMSPMGDGGVAPLSAEELGALAGRFDPTDQSKLSKLLRMDTFEMQRQAGIDGELAYRVFALSRRDALLYKLIDDCAERNTLIVTPFESEYPKSISAKLGKYQSPVLFMSGNPALLEGGYIGITGISGIKTQPELRRGLDYLVQMAAVNGFGVATGDEAGVCRMAIGDALEKESRVICVMTGGFYDYIGDPAHALAIKNKNMLVVTMAHPAAKYNPALVPLRTRLIFALSKAAFVLTSDGKRGEADAAKRKLCDNLYVLSDPASPPLMSLSQKGFTPVNDLSKLDVNRLAEIWSEPEVQQISFL